MKQDKQTEKINKFITVCQKIKQLANKTIFLGHHVRRLLIRHLNRSLIHLGKSKSTTFLFFQPFANGRDEKKKKIEIVNKINV